MSARFRLPRLPAFAKRLGLASAGAVLLFGVYGAFVSEEPMAALLWFLRGPSATFPSLLTSFERTVTLFLCSVAVAAAFRAGQFNLGGEGQVYAGAFSAAVAALALPGLPPVVAPSVALAAGALGGVALAAPACAAGQRRGGDVLLVSFLVAQGASPIIDWLIASPFRDTASNLVATPVVAAAFRLARLARPSALSVAAPLAAVIAFAVVARARATGSGFAETTFGRNPDFARSVGLADRFLPARVIALSGALHGLAGAFLVLAQEGRAVRGVSGGLGWNAIGAAMLAGLDPLLCLPASFFFAWIDAGARNASIHADLSADAGLFLKALVILVATVRIWPSPARLFRRRPARAPASRATPRDGGAS